MATAILRPHDCLGIDFRHKVLILPSALKPRRNPNPTHDASPSGRRKRNSPSLQSNRHDNRGRSRSGEPSAAVKLPAKNLVMGQVKILKRGEMLTSEEGIGGVSSNRRSQGEGLDSGLGSTSRLGPDPNLVQKQVKLPDSKAVDGIYAGSVAFFASPPPSSLPLPSFLGKNGPATNDLRRLLRLDLD